MSDMTCITSFLDIPIFAMSLITTVSSTYFTWIYDGNAQYLRVKAFFYVIVFLSIIWKQLSVIIWVTVSLPNSKSLSSHTPYTVGFHSGRMGDLTANLRGMREADGLWGRGESPGAVVETGGSGETYEGHIRRNFVGSKGASAAGIHQAWREKGRVGGGCFWQRLMRERRGIIGMLGWIQKTPKWEDDPVRRQDRHWWKGCRVSRGVSPHRSTS